MSNEQPNNISLVGSKVTTTADGKSKSVGYSFYRGDSMHFSPNRGELNAPDGLRSYLLKGWMPSAPFIDGDTNIIAFGSCFALNISNYLNNIGYNVATKRDTVAYVSKLGDGIVNTFALLQQFEWAWRNKTPQTDLWHGYKAVEFGYDEEVRLKTKEMFDEADVFIITLGLSEVWYDEPTGEVFWKAVPQKMFDPKRHKFRVASYDESLENLRKIHSIIREFRPEANIVFTLSPIPLAATFRDQSCITSNSASKAILKAALDHLYREISPSDPKLFYFPSYEIVLECFRNQFGGDRRHVYPHVLNINMKAFEKFFCKTGLTDEEIDNTYHEAILIDRQLGFEDNSELLEKIKAAKIDDFAKGLVKNATIENKIRDEQHSGKGSVIGDERRLLIRAKRVEEKRARIRAERVALKGK